MDSQAEAEFSEFMLGRWSRLVRLGYGLTGDQGLAEDLVAGPRWPRPSRPGRGCAGRATPTHTCGGSC